MSVEQQMTACAGSAGFIAGYTDTLSSYAATPWDFTATPIAPGDAARVCLRINSHYSADVTETEAQQAQTDTVTWRFAFDATAS